MESVSGVGIAEAIEVFVRGWSYTRSRTHPYVPERIGPAWVMRDSPRRGRTAKYRREEWVAHGPAAIDLHDLAREHTRGSYAICAVRALDEPDTPMRQAYKERGYRLGSTEALMVHPLDEIPRARAPFPIAEVTTPELAEKLAQAKRSRPRADLLTTDSPIRQYVALDGTEPVGWTESILVRDDSEPGEAASTWCSNMFVDPAYRRRGIARALLASMLRDDVERGASAAVLLASHAGAKLYPVVGYQQIGELLLFTPPKK